MLRLLFLSIFFILLSTASLQAVYNPKPFSQIGDPIYNNIIYIEKLHVIERYKIFKKKIKAYSNDVSKAKKLGFLVQEHKEDKLRYLKLLRSLLLTNDFFIRTIKTDFLKALEEKNVALFSTTVESGLLDIQKYRAEILVFYKHHKDDVPLGENITRLLDEEAKKKARYSKRKTKKQIAKEKIQRVRESDAKKQKELEERLTNELKKKKERIREEQEKEFFH